MMASMLCTAADDNSVEGDPATGAICFERSPVEIDCDFDRRVTR
jgi:hypothetical protein